MRTRTIGTLLALAALAAGCGGDDGDAGDGPVTIRLLTHDSFVAPDGIFDELADDGIRVELLQGGDAGTVVNQAILTKGEPQADVLFGVDSTFLSRALDEELFVAHEAEGIDAVDAALRVDGDPVTPIDYGDVCLNYDKAWFADRGVEPPTSLEDLTDPAYRDLLVIQNPATSSPGLAFLLATVDAFGEDGWLDWWGDLAANGVQVVDGWEEAYYGAFSGATGSEGERPLVVSYASSPPAEVVFADPPVDEAPTGVVDASCYRQVEYAGVLAGTEHEDEAGRLVDFLLSKRFQDELPLSMYVFPVHPDAELPDVFVEHAARPDDVLELPAEEIGANRERWIDEWTDVVLR